MIDCISRGRLDCGFVRGVPYEIFAANTNPTQTVERLWEGIDLVIKAWTTHDGPFNFEGRFCASPQRQCLAAAVSDSRIRRSGSPARAISRTSRRWREPRLCLRHVPAAARQGEVDVRRLSQAYRRSRPAGRRRHRLHAAGLYRRQRDAKPSEGAEELRWYLQRQEPSRISAIRPAMCRSTLNVKALQGRVFRPHRCACARRAWNICASRAS